MIGLAEALAALDAAEAEPIRHRVNWTLPEEMATWVEFRDPARARGRASCDYLNRNPPRRSDCDCGAFSLHNEHVEDTRDVVIEAARASATGSVRCDARGAPRNLLT